METTEDSREHVADAGSESTETSERLGEGEPVTPGSQAEGRGTGIGFLKGFWWDAKDVDPEQVLSAQGEEEEEDEDDDIISDQEDNLAWDESDEDEYQPSGRERGIALRKAFPLDKELKYPSLPFFPVYKVRRTKNPDKLTLSPEPLKAILKRQHDPVEHFYKRYKDSPEMLEQAIRIATIVAGYVKDKPLEDEGFTMYRRSCLSGGFIAPAAVLTNMHGLRYLGPAVVKQQGGGKDVVLGVFQIATGLQALRGDSGLQSHFEDQNHERYILSVPEIVRDTDTRRAEVARHQGRSYASTYQKVVDGALNTLMADDLPMTKDPVTGAHFVDEESLDPDAVVLPVQYHLPKRPSVPADGQTTMHKVAFKGMSCTEGAEFATPSLWFDKLHGNLNVDRHMSLFLVGCPGQRAYKDKEIIEICPEFIIQWVRQHPRLPLELAIEMATDKLRLKVQAAHADEGMAIAIGEIARAYSKADAEAPPPAASVSGPSSSHMGPTASTQPRAARSDPDRLVASDEYLGHNAFTTPGWSSSLVYLTNGVPGCPVGHHCGCSRVPTSIKLWTPRKPWGTVDTLAITIPPPWNVALPFTSPSVFLRIIFEMYRSVQGPYGPYWTEAGSLGVLQREPLKHLQEFHLFYLAKKWADFEDANGVGREWVQFAVEHHDLDGQLRTPAGGTPPPDEVSYLASKRVGHQLASILEIPGCTASELRTKLKGEARGRSLGAIDDFMRNNQEVVFDLTDWPFNFLRIRSYSTLRWLVGRIVRPDTCTNYVNPDILAERLSSEELEAGLGDVAQTLPKEELQVPVGVAQDATQALPSEGQKAPAVHAAQAEHSSLAEDLAPDATEALLSMGQKAPAVDVVQGLHTGDWKEPAAHAAWESAQRKTEGAGR